MSDLRKASTADLSAAGTGPSGVSFLLGRRSVDYRTRNPPLTFLPSLSLELPSSSAWNRKFSSKKISPSLLFLTASSVSLPTQSGRKVTGLLRSSESLSACDFRVDGCDQRNANGVRERVKTYDRLETVLFNLVTVGSSQVRHQDDRGGTW